MASGYTDWYVVAYILADSGTGLRIASCDEDGRLRIVRVSQDNVTADATEAATWDATLSSLQNNLNRIRHQVLAITGEAWGTVSHSLADIWAKFHATTGHAHTGAAADGPILDHGGLSGKSDDDHTQYLLASGARALAGNLSMGSHKLTSVLDPTSDQDAATKKYVDDNSGVVPDPLTLENGLYCDNLYEETAGAGITANHNLKFAAGKYPIVNQVVLKTSLGYSGLSFGDTVNVEVATEYTQTGSTPTKKVEFTIPAGYYGGKNSVDIYMHLKSSEEGKAAYGRVYVNGAAYGDIHEHPYDYYDEYFDQVQDLTAGDLVQVYIWAESDNTAYLNNTSLDALQFGRVGFNTPSWS